MVDLPPGSFDPIRDSELKHTRAERNAWRNLATARASILSAYRTHRQPPGWALDMAHRARTELERMGTFHE